MICVQNQKYSYMKVSFEINKNFTLNVLVSNSAAQNRIFYVEKNYIAKLLKNYNNENYIFKKYKE